MVTVNNNSPILDHIHLDAHAQLTYDNVMSFSQWYKLLKKQLISSSTALLTVISNKIVSGLEVLLSIQKGTVVCNGGGGGVPLACALSNPQMCYFWQSGRIFALQMPSLQQLNFFGDLTPYFSHLGSLFEPYFCRLINWLFYLKLILLASLSHRRNIPPDKKESYLKSCTYNPKTDPLCPIIKLGTIVKEAGEDYNKLAYKVKENVLSTKICVIYKIPWWR